MALPPAHALFKADLTGPEAPFVRWVVSQDDVVPRNGTFKPSSHTNTWARLDGGKGPRAVEVHLFGCLKRLAH